jgi:uncharacterized membrane protein
VTKIIPNKKVRMKAQQLLLHATQTFGSGTTKVIGQAFDGAWAGMAFLSPWSAAVECLRLATIVLAVATHDSQHVEALKAAGPELMSREAGICEG